MVYKVATLFLVFGRCAAATADPKILGGVETTIEDVPYQLELQARTLSWFFWCGAVIIGETDVLTAGRCIQGHVTEGLRILSGATRQGNGTTHTIKVATIHPDYHMYHGTAVNDVAYLKVTPPFILSSSTTQAIKLTEREPSAGEDGLTSGWGVTSEGGTSTSSLVRKVEVPIISHEDCIAEYIDNSMICAGVEEGSGPCHGDDGGPLVVNGALAGLVSWGRGCSEGVFPVVYTNVNFFSSWINEQIVVNK